MQSPVIQSAVIVVSAEAWKRYREAKARASAMEREAKQLGEALGLPDADSLASQLELRKRNLDKGEIAVHDGNGNPIGKMSVYHHPGATIPPGWRKRES